MAQWSSTCSVRSPKPIFLTFIKDIRDSLPFISDNLTKRSNSHGNPTKVVLFLTGYFDQLVLGKLYTFPEVLHAHFMNPTNWLATLLRKKNFANNIWKREPPRGIGEVHLTKYLVCSRNNPYKTHSATKTNESFQRKIHVNLSSQINSIIELRQKSWNQMLL